MATSWNVFRIGRKVGDEDQLTEMLVWLAEAVPEVTGVLLRLSFSDHPVEVGDVQLTTQHGIVRGRLDALLTSADLALVVESKLGSTYEDDQIGRYLAWLATEFGDRARRGLLTLTAQEAPWPEDDVAFAAAHTITASARRWGDLYEFLEPLTDETVGNGLGPRLVREFRDMLADEGLVPLRPLDVPELTDAWASSWRTIQRFRDFFHACKPRIADVLGAAQIANSWSDHGDYFWQDYQLENGARLVVGLSYTDELERIPTSKRTGSPIVFVAAKADQLDGWPRIMRALEADAPEGWTIGTRLWNERPKIWRPLAPLLSTGTFDDQRERLAAALAPARRWIEAALDDGGRAITGQ